MQILAGRELICLACIMVQFLLGYAAAGTTVQWCFLSDHTDQVGMLLVSACCLKLPAIVSAIVSHLASCSQRLDPHDHVASVLQPAQVMGDWLDVRSAKGRMSFLLSLVQAYRLLAVMSAAVPQLPGRRPLYSETERENGMYDSCMT